MSAPDLHLRLKPELDADGIDALLTQIAASLRLKVSASEPNLDDEDEDTYVRPGYEAVGYDDEDDEDDEDADDEFVRYFVRTRKNRSAWVQIAFAEGEDGWQARFEVAFCPEWAQDVLGQLEHLAGNGGWE